MTRYLYFITAFLIYILTGKPGFSQQLERLKYNNPGLLVDLGVGLWAWPLPMDYNDDGLTDLIVVCTDKPSNGVYFFENSGINDPERNLPVFKPAQRLGDSEDNAGISYLKGKPLVVTPGKYYPDFQNSAFLKPEHFSAPDVKNMFYKDLRTRANQWQVVDFNDDGIHDLLVGVGVWGPHKHRGGEYYGWDDAYNEKGQWTNGPLHGFVYLIENTGSNLNPEYIPPVQLTDTDGRPLDVYGRPSPNYADLNGDSMPDILCGEFRDGFTFFENKGSRSNPLFAPGRSLTNGDEIIRMDLCMITPVVIDFTGDGWPDLVVGDEDGRVALIEHTGNVVDGMPLFMKPRYFRQQACRIKFGALATPVGFDWNDDGLDDILAGNTAGNIAFIQNLGGEPQKWAAPELLKADDEAIRIVAGANGSIQGPAEAKWGYTTLSVADWNIDGLPDILVNSIWGKIIWYENTGTLKKPKLAAAKPVTVQWEGNPPKPEWNWWTPSGNELVTQWRTTPVAVDWTGDGLTDLVMLDHEGYLALFRRKKQNDKLVLMPGERIFKLKGEDGPLRLNNKAAGSSGRRKICVADYDGDGNLDILLNSENATFYKNTGMQKGFVVFEDRGLLDERQLAGHTSSPATINLSGEYKNDLLIGAEDGFLYYKPNLLHNNKR